MEQNKTRPTSFSAKIPDTKFNKIWFSVELKYVERHTMARLPITCDLHIF